MKTKQKMLTTAQAAKLVGVSTATVLRAARDGKIRSFSTPGGHFRIFEADAKNLLIENKSGLVLIPNERKTEVKK